MKYKAILALHNDTNPDTTLEIRGNVEKLTGLENVKSNNADPKFTWDQVLTKEKELQADYDAKKSQRDRAVAYDPIPEQLDQIYHDMDGWKAKIKAVKDKFPKPE